ncbi:MAG TPA: MurT ligase domain-containing protein [Candidatus Saccharibacteria bacterium]|nr:MurT ligase domain-containing protein [Candidatus Saccharibacteria bacterium]
MSKPLVTILGKAVRKAAQMRGGGSALPGLFVERIDPSFIKRTLSSLPHGVVVISGTNGKTTTTKMVVELLESQGLKVFTNRTGSNFTRGVAAALLGEINIKGHLDADIAVLELDEAHATNFVRVIPPKYSLLLNVMRDQLDRFGEIDHTTRLLRIVAEATTNSVVLNRDDARVASIADFITDAKISYFGLDQSLYSMFPEDDSLHGSNVKLANKIKADVVLMKISDQDATFNIDGQNIETTLKLTGIYNIYNVAAALALVRQIMPDSLNQAALLKALSNVTPAFGRGETLIVDGKPLELVLVKNPSGFRLGLKSFNPNGFATMIAINDNYADGRDMSWLWDVDFDSLKDTGVVQLSGIRAFDMALRLQYDEVPIKNVVQPRLSKALKSFLQASTNQQKRIYCTYTAMLTLRKELSKMTNVEVIK